MRFNRRNTDRTLNHEGALAYMLNPEMELYSTMVTTMLSDAYYESSSEDDGKVRMDRIRRLIRQVPPRFVAQLAVYAREQMHLRSGPVMLSVELAGIHNGNQLVSRLVERIVQRPDEITEVLAYYQLCNRRAGTKKLNRLSKQLQKGLGAAFNKFDEYQFTKYNRVTTMVKLRDALFLVHPKARSEDQQFIFNKIATDSLTTPYTWETELSALGQFRFTSEQAKHEAFRTKWEELIDSKRLGYMALLRNLRNILEAGVSTTHIGKVCSYLASATAIERSKQLPFRFLAAYREIRNVPSADVPLVIAALEQAVSTSIAGFNGFGEDTRVVIACDVSGSMQQPVSPGSRVLLYDIGLLLGMLLQSRSTHVLSGMFGNRWQPVILTSTNVLANVEAFYKREGEVGYSTNGYLVLEELTRQQHKADKIMFFTDTQLWDSHSSNPYIAKTMRTAWLNYKKLFPDAKLFLFDLAGYGQTPLRINEQDVYLIAGWSDKIFDVLWALEDGQSALELINSIQL